MPYENSPNNMGHSPSEMESNKQEKYNLMHDNPVAKHASWMSKHAQSSRMSPLNQEKDGYTVYSDRKNQKGESQVDIDNKRVANVNQAIKNYEAGDGTYNQYKDAVSAYNKSRDSIIGANVKMDKLIGNIKSGKY